jgi:lipopolysaccharide biosynthesis regulator YciM
MALAQLQASHNRSAEALTTLLDAARAVPQAVPLMAQSIARMAVEQQRHPQALAMLQEHYQQARSLDVLEALIQIETDAHLPEAPGQAERYAQHLAQEPSLLAASRWIRNEPLTHEQHRAAFERALDRAAKPLQRYRCAACGFEAQQHFWQCPGCQNWDSYPPRRVEEL